MLKTAEAEELIEAVQILGRGDGLLAPQVTRRVIARFTATQPQHAAQVSVDVLTEREQTTCCAARGLTNAEIAAELFVKSGDRQDHVSNILSKLGLRDRISAVIWAYEHGLVSPSSA